MSVYSTNYDQSGSKAFTFQFENSADIARIIRAIGISPVSLEITRSPQYVNQSVDSNGDVIWRKLGPENAAFTLEGYLFCESKFRDASGFSYNGDSFVIESRSITRDNKDFIMCRLTGASHESIQLPDRLTNTSGFVFGIEPVTSANQGSISVSFADMPLNFFDSHVPASIQAHLYGNETGLPAIQVFPSSFGSSGVTFTYDGEIPNSAAYQLSYSVGPATSSASSYKAGSVTISQGSDSATISLGTSYVLPWLSTTLVIPPSGVAVDGAIDFSSVSNNSFDFLLDSDAPQDVTLSWDARQVGEYDPSFAYGRVDLDAGVTELTIDYSAWGFIGTPRFVKAEVAAPSSSSDIIGCAVIKDSVTSLGYSVQLDAATPNNSYRLYWSARLV